MWRNDRAAALEAQAAGGQPGARLPGAHRDAPAEGAQPGAVPAELQAAEAVHVARDSIVFPFDFTGLAEQYHLE